MGKEAKKADAKNPKDKAADKNPKYTVKDGGKEKEDVRLPSPPPPEEVVMRIYMNCEACTKKVKKILMNFDGVEDVIANSKTQKVVVKGKKVAINPMKVVEHIQKKSIFKVELLSPIQKRELEKMEVAEMEENKEPMITVVLKVHIHCEVCAQWIRKRILKIKGVQFAEPDIKASKMTVKGVFDVAKFLEYVYKHTGKHATIIKPELVPPQESIGADSKAKEEKIVEDDEEKGNDDTGGEDKNRVDKEDATTIAPANSYMYYPHFTFLDSYYPSPLPPGYIYQLAYAPPSYTVYPQHYQMTAPQIFSDENPDACPIM